MGSLFAGIGGFVSASRTAGMSPEELAAECVKSINGGGKHIILTGRKTLFPKGGGPRPIELLCDLGNRKTWLYDAQNVLAALAANGLIDVKFGGVDEQPE